MNGISLLTEAGTGILRLSWEASVFLLLMGLLLRAGREVLSPRFRMILWGIVALRFLLPVTPESDLSLFRRMPAFTAFTTFTAASSAGEATPPRVVAPAVKRDRGGIHSFSGRGGSSRLLPYFSVLWLLGVVLVLGGGVRRQRRALKEVSAWPELRDRELLRLVREAGIEDRVKVVEQARGGGVGVFGFFRASHLILPADFRERHTVGQVRGILRHEAEHIRGNDLGWNWAFFFIGALHWFNPLVRLVARQWRHEREIRCDEAALRDASFESRRDYGSGLIRALEGSRLPALQGDFLPFISKKREMKQRLNQIMKNPVYPVIPQIGVALLASVAVFVTFTSAATSLRADEGKPRPVAEANKPKPGREGDANRPKEKEKEGGVKGKEGEGKKTGPKEGEKAPLAKKNSREAEIFEAYDHDSDGFVTAKEMEAMMEGKQNAAGRRELRKAVDQADKNGDAKLNLAEFEFWYKTGRFDTRAENQ